jgi:hypothetical protein
MSETITLQHRAADGTIRDTLVCRIEMPPGEMCLVLPHPITVLDGDTLTTEDGREVVTFPPIRDGNTLTITPFRLDLDAR